MGKLSTENRRLVREYGSQAVFLGAFGPRTASSRISASRFTLSPIKRGDFQGQNGFIIPAANLDALGDKPERAAHHRDELSAMRFAARNTAERYPWSRFRGALVEALQSLRDPR